MSLESSLRTLAAAIFRRSSQEQQMEEEFHRLVMRDVATILAGGALAGVAISLFAVRLVQKFLFGLTPDDPATFLAAVVLLSTVAVLAAYLPARRAMQVDPMVALRYE